MVATKSDQSSFHYQGPIRDHEQFFNRDADVRRVLSRLRKGQSVSVVGKGKIGKTSFLYYVSQVAARHGFTSQKHLFFHVDCKQLADLSEDDCFDQIKAVVEKRISIGDVCSVPASQGVACSSAYVWLEQVFSRLQQAGVQLIVQLDDFEWLATNTRLGLRLFDNLRALADVHDAMAYLTTSRVSLCDLQGDIPRVAGSPLFGIFWDYELKPFESGETRRFVVQRLESLGVACPEIVLESISELSQDEPYRLQIACACACDVRHRSARDLCAKDCAEIKELFERILRSTLDNSM